MSFSYRPFNSFTMQTVGIAGPRNEHSKARP